MMQTQTWFSKLSSASDTASKSVRPLVGGLNMVGAGGLAAGLSIAGLTKQFVDLAKALPALQELSRQTGMSRTEIERLKATASQPGRRSVEDAGFAEQLLPHDGRVPQAERRPSTRRWRTTAPRAWRRRSDARDPPTPTRTS